MSSYWTNHQSVDCQQSFLVADDYRSHPSYSVPFSKSDDEANEKRRGSDHEHLFANSIIGIETGSKQDNIKKDETNNRSHTKRLGEVDYTKRQNLKTTTYSAIENTNINITIKIGHWHIKGTRLFTKFTFKNLALKRLSIIAVLIIKESVGTGVLSPHSRPF